MATLNEEGQALKAKANQIAAALGEDWKRDTKNDGGEYDSGWSQTLNGPGGVALFLNTTWGSKGRLYIGGTFPNSIDRNSVTLPTPPSITVDPAKDAAKIAQDIKRRLLPVFEPLLAEALKKHVADLDYKARKAKTLRDAEEVTGLLARKDCWELYAPDARLTINSPESISVERFDVTIEELRILVNALPRKFAR